MTDDQEPEAPAFVKWVTSSWLWWVAKTHGTKVLGFGGATVSVFSAATNLMTPRALQITLLVSGLLTAWRGFFNSK